MQPGDDAPGSGACAIPDADYVSGYQTARSSRAWSRRPGRCSRLLDALARQPGPVPAAVLVRELGLPRSTVYHLLAELDGRRLRRPPARGAPVRARASPPSSSAPPTCARSRWPGWRGPVLARLVDRVGQSAHLAVLHGREVLYVVEERAPGRPSLVTDVGVRLPAHLTASGRAMLAALPAAQVRALFPDAGGVRRPPRRRPAIAVGAAPGARRACAGPGYADRGRRGDAGLRLGRRRGPRPHRHPVAGVAVTFESTDAGSAGRERLARAALSAAAELTRRIGGRVP